MFGKLEQMREIITEVNTQFKDPVRLDAFAYGCGLTRPGEDDVRLCLHLRVPVSIRDRTTHSRIDAIRD